MPHDMIQYLLAPMWYEQIKLITKPLPCLLQKWDKFHQGRVLSANRPQMRDLQCHHRYASPRAAKGKKKKIVFNIRSINSN
jgi:transposase